MNIEKIQPNIKLKSKVNPNDFADSRNKVK